MAEVNGKWAAYKLNGNGFHTCKQQQQQKKQEQLEKLTLEQMDVRLKRVEKMLFDEANQGSAAIDGTARRAHRFPLSVCKESRNAVEGCDCSRLHNTIYREIETRRHKANSQRRVIFS